MNDTDGLRGTPSQTLQRLAERLRVETRAEVRFDRGSRGLYATDASLYQIMPIGVAIPRVSADVPAIVRIAFEEGVPIVARGGATSLSGQTVGDGLVIDFSKYLNRVGVVDRDQGLVHVESGVVLDQLNAHLGGLGLMFAPDVSTSDRATIGGMIGNNSAGARSLRYGKTVDHVHALDCVLDDGTPVRFGPLDSSALAAECTRGGRVAALCRTVRDEVSAHEASIRARFPRILRRVSGYNLDEFVPGLAVRPRGWLEQPWEFNLARLIVGSEGTLAVVAGGWLRVVPKPAAQGLVVCSFRTVAAALESVETMLKFDPIAVEMLDRMILDLAAAQPTLAAHLGFVDGAPEAVLAAQFHGASVEEVDARCHALAGALAAVSGVLGARVCGDDASRASFWKVRKAGLALLMGMVGDAKPVAFVEDTAVATPRLPEFYERFRLVVAEHGASASVYGHADVGCLHIRPILDLKTARGVAQLRAIAADVAALVGEFGGAMSGEHGDGLARSRWNRQLFGEEVYGAFARIKGAFDPRNRLNPGKVVGEPPIDAHLRIGPEYRAHEPAETAFDFSAQGGFARAIELCSGVGVCRKSDTGTMCPSYMVTRDEQDTTRGRANALRLALTGELPDGLASEELANALDLCLQCKGCKAECPSNVDLAKLKAETLHQLHKSSHVPLPALAMAYLDRLYPMARLARPLANWFTAQHAVRWVMEKTAGIDRRRVLPQLAKRSFKSWFRKRNMAGDEAPRGDVVLFVDCFTNHLSPDSGIAAVRVLEAGGYRVRIADVECCGRTAISKGVLDRAHDLAARNLPKLEQYADEGLFIVGCEPSCILTFGDEYREFRLGSAADRVARRTRLIDDFVSDPALMSDLPLREMKRKVILHGHCHQKAAVGTNGSVEMLRRIPGVELKVLDSGCCGMAGSFGYEAGHYEVSRALAERVILPACRAEPNAVLAAPGFSCRSQVRDFGGIEAVHPIELIAEALGSATKLR